MNLQREPKPRIVIYGTGQFGQAIARFAVQKGWTLVAAYNRPGAKVGQDIGRLAGLGRDIGVVVQDAETARYDKLDADIGVVTSGNNFLRYNLPAYERLMNAGLNVICHGIEAYYPYGNDAIAAAEIEALARKNGVTFTGGGIWDMSRLWPGIMVAGPCTEIASMLHRSVSDAARAGKTAMLEAGVGLTKEEFQHKGSGKGAVTHVYQTVPMQVLSALGYTVTEAHTRIEPAVFERPFDCPLLGRVIPPGECVGSKVVAEVETEEGVTARAEIEARLFWPGEVEHLYWAVDGMPVTRTSMEREHNAHATISSLFNRIPDVIAAPPGIVPCTELGPMKHSALQRA